MVNWTADNDAKLLVGILEFQNMSLSKGLLEHLAEKMGEGCTPKAVNHRLNILKAKAKADGKAPATPVKDKDATNGTATPRTPASKGGRGRGKKATTTSGFSDENVNPEDNDELMPSPSAGKKRGRPAKKTADAYGENGESPSPKKRGRKSKKDLEQEKMDQEFAAMSSEIKMEAKEEVGDDDDDFRGILGTQIVDEGADGGDEGDEFV